MAKKKAPIDVNLALELSDGSAVMVRSANERFVEVCLQSDVDREGIFIHPVYQFSATDGEPVLMTADRGETRTLRNAK
jgi:hypothetical protein